MIDKRLLLSIFQTEKGSHRKEINIIDGGHGEGYCLLPVATGKYAVCSDIGITYVAIGGPNWLYSKQYRPVIMVQVNNGNMITEAGRYFLRGANIAVSWDRDEYPLISIGRKAECYKESQLHNIYRSVFDNRSETETKTGALISIHWRIGLASGMPEIAHN